MTSADEIPAETWVETIVSTLQGRAIKTRDELVLALLDLKFPSRLIGDHLPTIEKKLQEPQGNRHAV